MSHILQAITEAQSTWEQKHALINALVKAGAGETSHLWLATTQELQDMASKVGIKLPVDSIDEAPIMGVGQPAGSAPSMQNQQPMAGATNKVQPVAPGAQVNISQQGQQMANAQPATNSIKSPSPQDMQAALRQVPAQDQAKFMQVLQQLAGIKQ